MLPVNVLAKRHLQQRQSHVEGLDKIRLPSQRVVPEGIMDVKITEVIMLQ